MSPRITVIFATRNRRDELLATLERHRALPESPPLIVVDNGSTDGSPEAVRARFPEVEVVALGENRGGGARTVGAQHAATPYVAFSDDDSWWAPGSLARAVELLDHHPRLAVLAARVLVGSSEKLDRVCQEMADSPLGQEPGLPGPSVLGFVACGAVVRRDAFLAVGGFETRFGIGGEEELLALDLAAAGWGLAYVEDVVAHHYPSPQRDRPGRNRTQLRNALWSAWLRRPLPAALRCTVRLLRQPGAGAALGEALRGLPWALSRRRPVPPAVEAALCRLGH